ncbi:MAG: energy-coupling factor transporter transmembrane component T [Desulfomonilaceae bacterium]|nr:energy-coupling factor transporter transmembrane component T [Desulfomonilaceae bacterium]
MKSDITIGGYLPLDSVLHGLDPRTKLLGLIAMLASIFWSPVPAGVLATAVPIFILAVLSRAGWKIWLRSTYRFAVMLAAVLGLNVFFRTQGRPVFMGQWELPITWEGLEIGLIFTFQIMQAIVAALVLTFTTSPTEMSRGVELLSKPLKRLRVPVDDLGMVVLLAMRFVPLLQQELNATIEAQKSRGVDFRKGRLSTRAGNLVALLSPALSGALRRADLLALAMTARGFQPGGTRTQFKPLKFRRADRTAVGVLLLFLGCRLTLLP